MTKKVQEYAEINDLHFNNIDLLQEAFTHRSYINEHKNADFKQNERLEFLGDAVLELIISEHLFHEYKDRPEGELTSFRAATVKTETLANIARKLDMGSYLRMSKGEDATGGREKDYLLANVYEAVLGSIYIDQGFEECKKYVHTNLVPLIEIVVENRLDIDPKTKFQEIAQSLYKHTPTYKLISSEGPDHEKIFTMAVIVGTKKFGEGQGNSKQRAEEQAAEKALLQIQKLDKTAVNA